MKFGLPDAVCSVGTITWVVRHQWARLDIAQLDHYIYNFNHTTASTYSFMQAYLGMLSQWNSIFKYLTITTSVLPGNCNCKATSQTDADLKAVNGRVKHCVRDTSSNGEPAPKCGKYTNIYICNAYTPEQSAQIGKYAEENRPARHFCNYCAQGYPQSRLCNCASCYTMQKMWELNFGDLMLDYQIAKFYSPPITLAIWYISFSLLVVVLFVAYS